MFDIRFARQNGWPDMHHIVLARRVEWAREQLRIDPYNHVLIDDVMKFVVGPHGEPASLEPTEQRALARRALVFNHYDPRAWLALAFAEREIAKEQDPLAFAPYMVNAVVFSNHGATTLLTLLQERFQVIEARRRFEAPPSESKIDPRFIAPYRQSALGQLDDRKVICPFVAEFRLFVERCRKSPGEEPCRAIQYSFGEFHAISEDAARRNLCPLESYSALDDLYYTADLSLLPTQ